MSSTPPPAQEANSALGIFNALPGRLRRDVRHLIRYWGTDAVISLDELAEICLAVFAKNGPSEIQQALLMEQGYLSREREPLAQLQEFRGQVRAFLVALQEMKYIALNDKGLVVLGPEWA